MASRAQHNDEYTTLRQIGENLFLVRRNADGETLLGRPFNLAGAPEMEHLDKLMGMGAGAAVSHLLNHENLVSVATTLTSFTWVGSGPSKTHMLLWDYCDAGTLDGLFRTPPVAHSRAGFLPESLCWHVLRSVLAALAWLHDGYRVDYFRPSMGRRPGPELRSEWIADPDWLPVLHRAVRPENIYFQSPRGVETYGLCKLGNFGEAFVSGHVNWVSGGAVVSTREGDSDLLEMKKRMAVENIYTVPKVCFYSYPFTISLISVVCVWCVSLGGTTWGRERMVHADRDSSTGCRWEGIKKRSLVSRSERISTTGLTMKQKPWSGTTER